MTLKIAFASFSFVCAALVYSPAALADHHEGPAPASQEPTEQPASHPAVSEHDVAPSMIVYSSPQASLRMGGLVQLHLAPYVGDDSLLDNDDVASRAGFLLRRARLGVEANFDAVRVYLVLSPLTSDPDTGSISYALVSYEYSPQLRIDVGADKVPFTRGELQSSSNLDSIERPLSVRTFVPQRRLGATLRGSIMDGALSYVGGVLNATEGYELGNRNGGMLYVGRLEFAIIGSRAAPTTEFGLTVGAGGIYEMGPATTTMGASADLQVSIAGATVMVEALCTDAEPTDSPDVAPTLADNVQRCGAYAQLSYDVPDMGLRPSIRAEMIDDNRDVDDAGDGTLVSAGASYHVNPHLRLQMYYLGRFEKHGGQRANDSVVLGLQGKF